MISGTRARYCFYTVMNLLTLHVTDLEVAHKFDVRLEISEINKNQITDWKIKVKYSGAMEPAAAKSILYRLLDYGLQIGSFTTDRCEGLIILHS